MMTSLNLYMRTLKEGNVKVFNKELLLSDLENLISFIDSELIRLYALGKSAENMTSYYLQHADKFTTSEMHKLQNDIEEYNEEIEELNTLKAKLLPFGEKVK